MNVDVELTNQSDLFYHSFTDKHPEIYVSIALFTSPDEVAVPFNGDATLSSGPYDECTYDQRFYDPTSGSKEFVGRYVFRHMMNECCSASEVYNIEEHRCMHV